MFLCPLPVEVFPDLFLPDVLGQVPDPEMSTLANHNEVIQGGDLKRGVV